MKTYDVIFNDELDSNSNGFKLTKQEAIDYIQAWNGSDHSYFADYKGGIVEVRENGSDAEAVYWEEVR